MEIVNKPFTMPEYELDQKTQILLDLESLKYEVIDYPRLSFDKLMIITKKLVERLYGNNNS